MELVGFYKIIIDFDVIVYVAKFVLLQYLEKQHDLSNMTFQT